MEAISYDIMNSSYKGIYYSGSVYAGGKRIADYSMKRYTDSSDYGINGGRISKLEIKDAGGHVFVSYDRGWDIAPAADNLEIFNVIVKKYN